MRPVRLLAVRLIRLWSRSLYDLLFCLGIVNVIDFSISNCC